MVLPRHSLIELHRHPYANEAKEQVMPGLGEVDPILLSGLPLKNLWNSSEANATKWFLHLRNQVEVTRA